MGLGSQSRPLDVTTFLSKRHFENRFSVGTFLTVHFQLGNFFIRISSFEFLPEVG